MTKPDTLFCTVDEALSEIQHGRVLVVIDGPDRYGNPHLVGAVDESTLDTLLFMDVVAGGLMCLAHPQSGSSDYPISDSIRAQFAGGAVFGNSESGMRTHTDRTLSAPDSVFLGPHSIKPRPLVPLRTRKQGVLSRPGHAEAIVDLARLAGLSPAGFLCAVVERDDRPYSSLESLVRFARSHELRMFCVTELIRHRLTTEVHVKPSKTIRFGTQYGDFSFVNFASDLSSSCAVLVKSGATFESRTPLVHIEPVFSFVETSTGVLTYLRDSFDIALSLMHREGDGIVICVPTPQPVGDEERFLADSSSYFREDPFLTLCVSPHRRLISAGLCAQVLHHLHITRIRVTSGRPQRLSDLKLFGIDIVSTVPSRREFGLDSSCRWMVSAMANNLCESKR